MKHQKKIKPAALLTSIAVSFLCIAFSLWFSEDFSIALIIQRLLFPLVRLMMFISVGLLAGQIIEHLGWTRQMAVVARPIFKFAHLGDRCGAAFTSAFISGATANAMLLDFYEDGKISKMQLFLTNYMNHFPAFFLHLPTTVFIVLPLTGFAGGLYFVITFLATLFRMFCFMVAGHLLLPAMDQKTAAGLSTPRSGSKPRKPVFATLKTKLLQRILKIFIWVLPIYTLVFILHQHGFFDYLNHCLADAFTLKFMPVESLSVVILSFAAEFTSGFAAAGALMSAGVITTKQTVIALLAGNVLAFPIRALRHQLPRYMGIFSPRMGLQLLLSGQLFRVLSIILIGTLYYMVA